MKTYLIYLYLLLCVVISSCRKDLGNYDYKELSEMQINNIEDTYTALTGQPLNIDPEFVFDKAKDFREDEYTYRWTAIDQVSSGLVKPKIISNEARLSGNLELSPSSYKIYFRVTEKATNIFWQKEFKVEVTSEMAGGWLLLNESNNQARLDMLNYSVLNNKFTYYKDVIQSFGGPDLVGKPDFVYYLQNRDIYTNGVTNRVYVGTDHMTYSFNVHKNTWDSYRNIKTEVLRPTAADYRAVKVLGTGGLQQTYMIDNEGNMSLESVVTNNLYGTTMNRLNTGGKIAISPMVAEGFGTASPYLVMYDTANRRFIAHSGTNSTSMLTRSSNPAIFDPANMEKDLVFMDYVLTTQKQFNALLKDPNDGTLHLLRFTGLGAIFTPLAYDVVPASQDLEKATYYAVDPTHGYLIYAKENKLYSYNPFLKTHTLMADYGARQISKIKYQRILRLKTDPRLMDYGKSLVVCTYDPNSVEKSGKMELFGLSLDSKLTLKDSYEGFDKIVDVSYKE